MMATFSCPLRLAAGIVEPRIGWTPMDFCRGIVGCVILTTKRWGDRAAGGCRLLSLLEGGESVKAGGLAETRGRLVAGDGFRRREEFLRNAGLAPRRRGGRCRGRRGA